MKFSDLLSALGIAPKTLPQARELIDPARATLDSVAALFTAAGLDLEPMLAAGPESLKAYLAELDNTEELATALLEVEQLESKLTAAETAQSELVTRHSSLVTLVAGATGIQLTPETKAEDIKAAFADHIAKATTLALAQTGHPPVVHVPADAPLATDQAAEDEAHLKAYEALAADKTARAEYFAKHDVAIWRAAAARRG